MVNHADMFSFVLPSLRTFPFPALLIGLIFRYLCMFLFLAGIYSSLSGLSTVAPVSNVLVSVQRGPNTCKSLNTRRRRWISLTHLTSCQRIVALYFQHNVSNLLGRGHLLPRILGPLRGGSALYRVRLPYPLWRPSIHHRGTDLRRVLPFQTTRVPWTSQAVCPNDWRHDDGPGNGSQLALIGIEREQQSGTTRKGGKREIGK